MAKTDREVIQQFLATVAQPDLFEYYALPLDAAFDTRDAAVRKRRLWAQGQQNNPKHRTEALFLIKHNSLLRQMFVEDGEEYRRSVDVGAASTRAPVVPAAALAAGAVDPEDLYGVLGAPADTDTSDLADAWQARWREIRRALPGEAQAAALAALDRAWQVLGDPDARARYDASIGRPTSPPEPPDSPAHVRAAEPPADRVKARVSDPAPTESETRPRLRPAVLLKNAPTSPLDPRQDSKTDHPSAPRACRLVVDGPSNAVVHLRSKPVAWTLTIRNAGTGQMPGRIAADRPWVEISDTTLDPRASVQTRVLTFRPDVVPPAGGTVTVQISTVVGDRRTITLDVRRRSLERRWVRALVVGAVALVALGAWRISGEGWRSAVGGEGAPEHPVPLGNSPPWSPPPGVPPVDLGADAEGVILDRASDIARCFPRAPAGATATLTAYVGPDGGLLGLSVASADGVDAAGESCLRDLFLTMRFPSFSGEYAVVHRRLPLIEAPR